MSHVALRDIPRMGEILLLALRYLPAEYLDLSSIRQFLRGEDVAKVKEAADSEGRPELLAKDFERMGPTFVKLGQLLSSRADLLPAEYLIAMARLQDDVEPIPFEQIRGILDEELPGQIDESFAVIEADPLAAASIGQVHRAKTTAGQDVVIKVQRPGVRGAIEDDLRAMGHCARLLSLSPRLARYQLVEVVRQFRRAILNELDYQREAENLLLMASNLRGFKRLIVPTPIDTLTSERVLTMDFVAGKNVGSIEPNPVGGAELADELFHAYLQQVVVDGFFHADPHPGNVMLTESGQLALLDLGMVERVSPGMQDDLLSLLLASAEGRSEEVVDIAINMGYPDDEFNQQHFAQRIGEVVSEYQGRAIRSVRVGEVVLEIARTAAQSRLRVPSSLTLLGKMLMHLDQVGKRLCEDFDPNRATHRHVTSIMKKRVAKQFMPARIAAMLLDSRQLMESLPRRLDRILELVSSNRVRIHVIDEDRLIEGIQKVANGIATGLVLAALIIAAALLMNVDSPHTLFGYPIFALVLFLVSGTAGFAFISYFLLRR